MRSKPPRARERALGPCPVCRGPRVHPDQNEVWPFCSKRCRAADLGRWLAGEYVISSPVPEAGSAGVPDEE